jgi:hypothetical protein
MPLDALMQLVPPPAKPTEVGTLKKWRDVEKKLGTNLPVDYREFVFAYGTGLFAKFYRVYNPFAASEYTALLPQVQTVCKMERDFKESNPERVPYPIYPDAVGLLPWGNDENGNYYFWLTEGEPDEWTVAQNEARGKGYRAQPCSMTEFLTQVLQKKIKALASGYPQKKDMVFESWEGDG